MIKEQKKPKISRLEYEQILDLGIQKGLREAPDRFDEGFKVGETAGYAKGKDDGDKEGFKVGQTSGYGKGKADGHNEGYKAGVDTGDTQDFIRGRDGGHKKGKEEGFKEGYNKGHLAGNHRAWECTDENIEKVTTISKTSRAYHIAFLGIVRIEIIR